MSGTFFADYVDFINEGVSALAVKVDCVYTFSTDKLLFGIVFKIAWNSALRAMSDIHATSNNSQVENTKTNHLFIGTATSQKLIQKVVFPETQYSQHTVQYSQKRSTHLQIHIHSVSMPMLPVHKWNC